MPAAPLVPILRQLRRVAAGPIAARSDADLLGRFVRTRDEIAFEELVRRHGPAVWGVCTRLLTDRHAAEDAFQATFMVLARRAAAVGRPAAVGCWLYGVGRRVAGKLRGRRRAVMTMRDFASPAPTPLDAITGRELATMLDDELDRLPERLRNPLVLCYLDGRTRDEAAAALGLSIGTFKRRLEQGRAVLCARLTRRGVGLPAALLTTALLTTALAEGAAEATLPVGLAMAAARSASAFVADGLAGSAPAALAVAAMRTVLVTKVRASALLAAGVLALTVCLTGVTGADQPGTPPDPPKPRLVGDAAPRLDRLGDPLPPGALVRMGTVRLRHVADPNNGLAAAFSPDGHSVLTNNGAGLRLWDVATGKLRWQWDGENGLGETLFAPDGRTLAVSTGAGLLIVDAVVGQMTKRLTSDPRTFYGLAFSPDSRTLAAPAYRALGSTKPKEITPEMRADRIGVTLWDAGTGTSIATLPTEGMMPRHCGFTPDGKSLVVFGFVSNGRHRLMRFDLASRQAAPSIEVPFPNGQLSGDGLTLAVRAPGKGLVRFWDTAAGQDRGGIEEHISAFNFVDGGAKFVGTEYARPGGTARVSVWDVKSGERLHTCALPGQYIANPRLSSDGHTALAVDSPGTVFLCDLATGKLLHDFATHDGPAWRTAFTPDGKTLLTGGFGDGAVRVWDAATGEPRRLIRSQPREIHDFRLTADGTGVLSAGDGLPAWHELTTGREVCRFEPGAAKGDPAVDHLTVGAFCPQPGAPMMNGFVESINYAAQSRSRFRVMWKASGGDPVETNRLSGGEGRMGFSPDGRWSVTIVGGENVSPSRPWNWPPIYTKNATLVVRDVTSGRTIASLPQPDQYAYCRAWSADGQTLATLTAATEMRGEQAIQTSAAARLWEVRSGHERLTIPLHLPAGSRQEPSALALSADGRLLAASRPDGRILLFDAATGKELAVRSNPGVPAQCLEFRRDGRVLAAGNDDGTALIWDVADVRAAPGRPLDAGALESRWADLAGDDARKAHTAIWDMAATPGPTVTLLASRLQPVAVVPVELLRQRVAELESGQYRVREAAERDLSRVIDQAEPVLRAALRDNSPAEQRRRIEALLNGPAVALSPDATRALRAVEVLERIGSPAARKRLEVLAAGAPGATLTQNAAAAVKRLDRP
jgi:RNA polymerase sigma factor (sigma-70 family)